MSETWDGRPPGEAAERDGWHWLSAWTGLEGWELRIPWCAKWEARTERWLEVECDDCGDWADWPPERMANGHHYLGPCHPPAAVAARIAAAVAAEREACAAIVEGTGAAMASEAEAEAVDALRADIATAIRARPAPSGADALAAAPAHPEARVREAFEAGYAAGHDDRGNEEWGLATRGCNAAFAEWRAAAKEDGHG